MIDAFVASYQGREPSLLTRLAFWRDRLGTKLISEIDADLVDAEMCFLAQRGALKYRRGEGIVSANRPLSPATLNRHLVALGSVMTFARMRRLLPRSHVSPSRVSTCRQCSQSDPRGSIVTFLVTWSDDA